MEVKHMNLEMGNLHFYLPTRIIFGWGKVDDLASLAREMGQHALLVTMGDLPHRRRPSAIHWYTPPSR